MKTKVIMLVVCTLTLMSALKVQAQDEKFGVGLIGGATGIYDKMGVPVFGLNFLTWNIYTDFAFCSTGHENDTGTETWSDASAFMIHSGYEFKFGSRMAFIPVLGFSYASKGETDGSNWTITSTGQISNNYNITDDVSGFDYGGIFALRFQCWQVFLGGTRYAIYGGAAFTF